jgi:hypothetical protein
LLNSEREYGPVRCCRKAHRPYGTGALPAAFPGVCRRTADRKTNNGGFVMTRKFLVLTAAGLFAASTGVALAQSSTPSRTPGHEMQNKGSVKGEPGASGYSPGDRMHDKGSVKGSPGASGYAPGHK